MHIDDTRKWKLQLPYQQRGRLHIESIPDLTSGESHRLTTISLDQMMLRYKSVNSNGITEIVLRYHPI